jgi:haloacetate dehalogenase
MLTHYGSGVAPGLFGPGYVERGDWWRIGAIMAILATFIYLTIGLSYWKILGLWYTKICRRLGAANNSCQGVFRGARIKKEEPAMKIWEKYMPGFSQQLIDVGGVNINTLTAGKGEEAVLLLHGHPESYLIWRGVAPKLAEKYTVVVTDLRGYGDSDKPFGLPDHSTYSKRTMAADQVAVMQALGHKKFHLCAHDRGARVGHRLLLDFPDRVKSAALLDIIPTWDVFESINGDSARKYWHWFFYIRPYDFPETLLSANPEYFVRANLLSKAGSAVKTNFPDDVMEEYIRYYSDPATVHAISEDYRAAATIDLEHDAPDRKRKCTVPLLILWGADSIVNSLCDIMAVWQKTAANVSGHAIPDCGHFIPEERPAVLAEEITTFIEKNK